MAKLWACFWPKLGFKTFFFVGFTATDEPNLRQMVAKNLVWGLILAPLAHNWAQKIFSRDFSSIRSYLASSVTRYHGQLSSCTISEKTNDLILKNFSDGLTDWWTDGWTDSQTEKKDFIERFRLSRASNINNLHLSQVKGTSTYQNLRKSAFRQINKLFQVQN